MKSSVIRLSCFAAAAALLSAAIGAQQAPARPNDPRVGLKAGLYDNVIRLLFPLTIADQDLDRGLDLLEASLSAVAAAAPA